MNTASIAGLLPTPWLTPYAMTKHAVVGLSLSLRAEAAAHGVRVTAVCPGVVDTPMLDTPGPDDLPTSSLSGNAREFFRRIQPRFYAADQLAQDIVRGIDRNAALVIAPGFARAAWYLWRYAPAAVNRMNSRNLARSRAAFPSHPNGPADLTAARTDSTANLKFRLAHLGDTMVLVDPDRFAGRLQAAGFTDVRVQRGHHTFSFRALRPHTLPGT